MAKATLVESIPLGMEELRLDDDVEYTETALKRLVDGAQTIIHLAAMYWNLLPDPTKEDEHGFSDGQFEQLGARHGRRLLQALTQAAERGVQIRILQSPGFIDGPQESYKLARRFPEQVEIHELRLADWFGSGIMHQKTWVVDGRHTYIGSANMDWKSISQVKEMGILVEDQPQIAEDALKQFELFWRWSELEPHIGQAVDPAVGVMRNVPAWSQLLSESERSSSPFIEPELGCEYNYLHPMQVELNGENGELFISSHPNEGCAPGREPDLSGLLQTMQGAASSICINVMDYSPISYYRQQFESRDVEARSGEGVNEVIWWPILNDALLQAVMTRGVFVRILVSLWSHSSPLLARSLQALQIAASALESMPDLGKGKLEIKRFIVPGWDDTSGPERRYPGHSRVNHPKYIVTDSRLNIGTSNMSWRYFANSAGTSLNCTHASLVKGLQASFDRDWESRFAQPLE